jgi:hypothetical protein
VALEGHIYYAHRLAFAIKTGRWPDSVVDHINGQRSDNRWSNLRGATQETNQHNLRGPNRRNQLGRLGVSRSFGKFAARITRFGTVYKLGRFDTAEEAEAAYFAAKAKLDAHLAA